MTDETTAANSANSADDPRSAAPKRKLEHHLISDRLAQDTVFEVLRAYAAGSHDGSNPVSVPDAAKLAKVHESTPSLVSSFFTDVGLLTREGKKYRPCREVLDYQNAFGFDAASASKKLIPVFQRSWVWSALRPQLAMRPLTRDEVVKALAEAARATKEDRPRLEATVDFLAACSFLTPAEGGRFQGPSSSEVVPVPDAVDRPAQPATTVSTGTLIDPTEGTWAMLLLKKFPDFDPKWDDELKKSWFAAFDDLMKRGGLR
ncbi:hypothetical protein FBQ97_18465 [Acidobacteria bacterium ACD]|nr:hypothetical protein [Acidobacteria bacterium ACD]